MGLNSVNGNWSRVLTLVIPYFIIVGLFCYAGVLLLGLEFKDLTGDLTIRQTFVISICNAAGTFFVIWLFRKYLDKETVLSLGFNNFQVRELGWGLVMGALIMLMGYLLLIAANQITYLNTRFIWADFLFNFLFLILVAFTEEVLMRGYVLTNLMGSMNKYAALAVSSLLFSLMHMPNANYSWLSFVELFFAGILLGLSYVYTRNLWFPIALHFSWNFFQGAVFGFNISGRHITSIINHVRPSDTIWNGGAFGFEGSVLSLVFELIGIVVIYFLFRRREPIPSADPQQ